ncbi:glycosyltransferase family 9 protein [Candidatus Woesearchaeota archaeon]|nr:glycosyltransferase family 9 protein [Candidatus Woesearchaeota archaeon]
MYKTEVLTNFLAKEPIVDEKPIITDEVRNKWKEFDLKNIKSILVVMNQGLGDHLLILPLLRMLRKKYPSARIGIFCHKGYSMVYKITKVVDKIIPLGEEKEDDYELVINLNPPNDKIEEALHLFSPKIKVGLKTKDRKGYDFLVEDYLVSRPIHYLNFLRILNIDADINKMDFRISLKKDFKLIKKFNINENNKIISLCVGSSNPRKCLDPSKYAELAKELSAEGYEVILLGKSVFIDENKKGAAISESSDKIINLIDKTNLEEVMQIINISDLVISNDNGLMHLAAALERKIIALFGPTNPIIGGPNSDKTVVLNVTKENCDKKSLHYCENISCGRCIDKIEVKDILKLII